MNMLEKPASAGSGEACQFSDDLLEGAAAISEFLYGDAGKRRKVYHLAQLKRLPTFQFGAVLCARKSKILQWVKDQEEKSIGGDA